jgi:hypothetical protein
MLFLAEIWKLWVLQVHGLSVHMVTSDNRFSYHPLQGESQEIFHNWFFFYIKPCSDLYPKFLPKVALKELSHEIRMMLVDI